MFEKLDKDRDYTITVISRAVRTDVNMNDKKDSNPTVIKCRTVKGNVWIFFLLKMLPNSTMLKT